MLETVKVDLSQLTKFGSASIDDWRSVSTLSHNILLEGSEASTTAVLLLLEPHLNMPVVWKGPGLPLELPPRKCGALVLQEVAAMNGRDQARLFEWFDRSGYGSQVISTTAHSLFEHVERGVFDVALYYRLNVMVLQVDPTGGPGPRRQNAAEVTQCLDIRHHASDGASRRRKRRRHSPIAF